MQRAITTQATTWGPFLLQKQIVKSLPTLGSFSIQAYCLGTPSPIPPSPPPSLVLTQLYCTWLGNGDFYPTPPSLKRRSCCQCGFQKGFTPCMEKMNLPSEQAAQILKMCCVISYTWVRMLSDILQSGTYPSTSLLCAIYPI